MNEITVAQILTILFVTSPLWVCFWFLELDEVVSWFPLPNSLVNYMPPLEKKICLALRSGQHISIEKYHLTVGDLRIKHGSGASLFKVESPTEINFSKLWKGYLWREFKLARNKQFGKSISVQDNPTHPFK